MEQLIEVHNLSKSVVKSQSKQMKFSMVVLQVSFSVLQPQLHQQKTIAEVNILPVKHVVWSGDSTLEALMSKHSMWFSLCCIVFQMIQYTSNDNCEQNLLAT
jgi:hypothetical protein